MQRVVEPVERVGVAGLLRAVLRGEVGLQLGQVLLAGALGRQPDRRALQRLAHERRVLDASVRDQRDERPELRHDRHQPLVAQPHQRLAHGRAADAEPLGQLVLRQPPAGLQLGADDRLAQREVDLVARRDPRRALAEGDPHGHGGISPRSGRGGAGRGTRSAGRGAARAGSRPRRAAACAVVLAVERALRRRRSAGCGRSRCSASSAAVSSRAPRGRGRVARGSGSGSRASSSPARGRAPRARRAACGAAGRLGRRPARPRRGPSHVERGRQLARRDAGARARARPRRPAPRAPSRRRGRPRAHERPGAVPRLEQAVGLQLGDRRAQRVVVDAELLGDLAQAGQPLARPQPAGARRPGTPSRAERRAGRAARGRADPRACWPRSPASPRPGYPPSRRLPRVPAHWYSRPRNAACSTRSAT